MPKSINRVGKFGEEITLFRLFKWWMSTTSLLRDRYISIYHSVNSFYRSLFRRSPIEQNEKRTFVTSHARSSWMPVQNEHGVFGFDDLATKCLQLDPFGRRSTWRKTRFSATGSDLPACPVVETTMSHVFPDRCC